MIEKEWNNILKILSLNKDKQAAILDSDKNEDVLIHEDFRSLKNIINKKKKTNLEIDYAKVLIKHIKKYFTDNGWNMDIDD